MRTYARTCVRETSVSSVSPLWRGIRGPHPSATFLSPSVAIQAAPTTGFCRCCCWPATGAAQPSEPDARRRVCPRGCRLAVSWESRRVCTLVLEAVTLPCIAVLINWTSSSPRLTSSGAHPLPPPPSPPTSLYYTDTRRSRARPPRPRPYPSSYTRRVYLATTGAKGNSRAGRLGEWNLRLLSSYASKRVEQLKEKMISFAEMFVNYLHWNHVFFSLLG